jgi:hypothetical protein
MEPLVKFAGGNTVTIDGTRAYGNSYLASQLLLLQVKQLLSEEGARKETHKDTA